MRTALHHRAPDEQTLRRLAHLGLVHTRLALIDLEHDSHPMCGFPSRSPNSTTRSARRSSIRYGSRGGHGFRVLTRRKPRSMDFFCVGIRNRFADRRNQGLPNRELPRATRREQFPPSSLPQLVPSVGASR
ncbi:MAG: hypothetical protein BECKG1743D_GA0114223_109592 [Candidatus Kentron sp. G]|nr:MAG: hypothetical protein BECKG1743F_GA0114225_109552 [Candidatus Kentron sp. G]VFN05759.1 MAG: hypothetical protein BECKG1743E_GA0114224_109122 [Candidatus Kentron sp. G]VFN07006.1 MAG: hypothetical protein BECKG1743D_GA0114223_109592 [Candidatus Kentron sp. G]